jgi:cytochrome oxidase Cu insertion factor (SCO1/SenC/PrrC family)
VRLEIVFNRFLKIPVIVFFIFLVFPVFGQEKNTIIRGCDTTFSNKTIEIVVEDDMVTETQTTIFSGRADSTGCFTITLPLQETTHLTINFGKFAGVLYAEPERDYVLMLPSFEYKSIADSLNPYFEPVSFYFRIKNPVLPELNDAIANFDAIFNHFVAQYFTTINKYRYYTEVDTLAPFIDSLFSDVKHQYFIDYKNYSIAYLYALTLMTNHQNTVKNHMMNRPILYNNPAYSLLFNQIFKDYLPYYAETREGKRVVADIAKAKSYKFAMETLGNNVVLRDTTLRELVLIKSIYDALAAEQLPISSSFQTLDSIKILTRVDKHKKIIDNIKQKLTILAIGTKIPPFELRDADGNLVKSQDLQGKYVYLNFININSYTTSLELETLNLLHKKYGDKLRVVTIAVGKGTMPRMAKVFRDKKYEWLLLDGTDNEELEKRYHIKASPTCYLASSELRLIHSPSPGPNDYFEYYFIKVLRADRINKLRNPGSN